jgi:hypothetical protein
LELVAPTDDKLAFFWMYSGQPTQWNGPSPLTVDGQQVGGVTGVHSLIQSTFGKRQRNFQLVIPLITGGFMHYVRDNDAPDGQEPKWHIENEGRPIDPMRRCEALSLIQSNFGRSNNSGNLEVAALSSDGILLHFWMDSETKRWDGPYDFASF